jgi:flagellar hook-basal body complex protein FliE
VSATVAAVGTIASGIALPSSATSGGVTGAGADSSFGDTLKSLVDGVEGSSDQANTAVSGMLDKSVDVHDAMIALQRAEMSLQLAVQVRNKLVQAYQDIMRMPV